MAGGGIGSVARSGVNSGAGAALQQNTQDAPQQPVFAGLGGFGQFGNIEDRSFQQARPPAEAPQPGGGGAIGGVSQNVSAGGSNTRFTGATPPSGYRPMGDAPQFYQPVYQPQYTNYRSPFGGFGGFGGYGSPFGGMGGYGNPYGGFGGFGGYGSPYGGFGGFGGYGGGFGGMDPRAIAADPRGFSQMMQGAQKQEMQVPGSTFMSHHGIGSLWSQRPQRYQPMNFNPQPRAMNLAHDGSNYEAGSEGDLGDSSSPSDASGSGGEGGGGGAKAQGGIMRLMKK